MQCLLCHSVWKALNKLAEVSVEQELRNMAMPLRAPRRSNSKWSDETRKRFAWDNATIEFGTLFRTDCDGRRMRWEEYGKYSEYGWHIDHVTRTTLGGHDRPWNWRARHWYGIYIAGGLSGNCSGANTG